MGHARDPLTVKLLIRPVTPAGPVPATRADKSLQRHTASQTLGHTRNHRHKAQHKHQALGPASQSDTSRPIGGQPQVFVGAAKCLELQRIGR
jgi:hypothetical protein